MHAPTLEAPKEHLLYMVVPICVYIIRRCQCLTKLKPDMLIITTTFLEKITRYTRCKPNVNQEE